METPPDAPTSAPDAAASSPDAPTETFATLGLNEALVGTLREIGYETPTPIQARTIPLLLAGRDLVGQAQTGTGKTAAFALPLLNAIDPGNTAVQALVLTPTRELAIQVAEAVHTYAKKLGRVRVMPVYGGDSIQKQITRLRGGVQVIVGTPGRLMDHLRRGTMDLSALKVIVLDEADEMLKMGFIDDIEWILSQAPETRQTALFSATMPREVRRIAERYLRDPATVSIQAKALTVPLIEQRYISVNGRFKLDALTHLLEMGSAPGEAILIFTRTKLGAAEVSERLQARGYAAEAMHGDMSQREREAVIRRLRGGQVEIVVATDVAARGLDVEQITRVINFDIPNDPESYVHRIGRTGRAGRSGKAILFVAPREERMLREIERYTGQRILPEKVPTRSDVAARRMALFKERLLKTVQEEDLEAYLYLVEDIAEESEHTMAEIAAAAVRLAHGDKPLVVPVEPAAAGMPNMEDGMVRLFIDAGRNAGVRPADVVGAIANRAEVPGQAIGSIDIYDDFTLVEVPSQFAARVLAGMEGVTFRGQNASVRLTTPDDAPPRRPRMEPGAGGHRLSGPGRRPHDPRGGSGGPRRY